MGGSKNDDSNIRRAGSDASVKQPKRLGAGESEPLPSALDRWLNEKLRLLYGPVLSEPIPEHLTQLIELHRRDKQEC